MIYQSSLFTADKTTFDENNQVKLVMNFHELKKPNKKIKKSLIRFIIYTIQGVMTDVEFQVGPTKFYAHRVIISSRSLVFASMFGSSSVESFTGRIRIDNVDAAVFKEFLYFLYTGTLKSSANSQSLLNVAIRYEVETLIQICRIANEELGVDEILNFIIHRM